MTKPIKDRGKKFSKDYQPPTENKLKGKRRLSTIRDSLMYLSQQIKTTKTIGGNDIELTFEANIGYILMEKANKGDIKSIEILCKIMPNWIQASKIELKTDIGAKVYTEIVK